MAIAAKCDRCGVYFEPKETAYVPSLRSGFTQLVKPKNGTMTSAETIQICEDCFSKYKTWVKKGKETTPVEPDPPTTEEEDNAIDPAFEEHRSF